LSQLPVLWHFPISHYSEKVRWALDWKQVPHRREVLFADYPLRAWLATGQLALPILRIDGRAIADSTRIIARLEERFPEPPLYPKDPLDRARALEIEDWFDEELGHPLRTLLLGELFERDPAAALAALSTDVDHYSVGLARGVLPAFRWFYKKRHGIDAAARARAEGQVTAAFDRVEQERAGGPYLVGGAFSVADLTAAALLGPLVRPPESPHSAALELIPESVLRFREGLAAHPAFDWVLRIHREHRGSSAEVR